jgi:L-ascorbate metabolism protein UlaG (beta-lactamase superfamily)
MADPSRLRALGAGSPSQRRGIGTSRTRRVLVGLLVPLLGALVLEPLVGFDAAAQSQAPLPSLDAQPCTGLVSSRQTHVQAAAFRPDAPGVPSGFERTLAVQAGQVGLTFIGHATFLIESPGGVRIATDYNDGVRPPVVPDVVTMNHAHGTHYTDHPDPGIKHVLRGWGSNGQPARWDVSVGDVRIRNVPTNIRDWGGGTEEFGNSIFVFEVAGLCVAHLGHLHHTLLPGQLQQLGRIDVLLVPVDGSYTMDVDGMVEVLQAIHAPLMIPMHVFGQATLDRFLARVGQIFAVRRAPSPELLVSRESLPSSPTILVLPGR